VESQEKLEWRELFMHRKRTPSCKTSQTLTSLGNRTCFSASSHSSLTEVRHRAESSTDYEYYVARLAVSFIELSAGWTTGVRFGRGTKFARRCHLQTRSPPSQLPIRRLPDLGGRRVTLASHLRICASTPSHILISRPLSS
jgi:hypothetical protein